MSSRTDRAANLSRVLFLIAPLTMWFALACARPEPPPEGTPRLILLAVVDQMRGDYLERFGPLFDGGLRRIADEGLVYSEAHHRHAITSTGPGHASLATGCHPSRHGIINNYWFDRETGEETYSVDGDDPRRMACTALGDWLKERYPAAKVFSAGGKDRSAILLAGHRADAALWYDWEGGFTTSDYYRYSNSHWLSDFNATRPFDQFFGTAWEPRPVADELLVALGIVPLDLGPLRPVFPHVFGGMSPVRGESFYNGVFSSPWLDRLTGALAQRLIGEEKLGDDPEPDLLALVFSGVDAVGHRYGPDSRELLDTLLSLDRTLDELLDFVDEKIGLEHVLVALTSDHGAAPMPEVRRAMGLAGRRVGNEEILCVQAVEAELDRAFGEARWLRPGPVLDEQALAEHGVARPAVEEAVVRLLEACPSVARVWTRSELTEPGAGEGKLGRPWVNAYHPDRSPDFLIQWDEHFLPTRSVASTHGSAYRYDTWVPLAFMSDQLEPGSTPRPVATVDLAPTLAAMVDVPVPDGIDGVDLRPQAETGAAAVAASPAARSN